MTTRLKRAPLWGVIGIFLVSSLLLSLLWHQTVEVYQRLMAGPVTAIAVVTSPDISGRSRAAGGECEIELETGRRYPVEEPIGKVAMLSYPVFLSLLLAGLGVGRMRQTMRTGGGMGRVVIGIIAIAVHHLLLSVVLLARLGALQNRGSIPPVLRFLGALGDVTQAFFPFVLFVVLFFWWPPSPSSEN